jgi:hypothetical protein
VPLAELSAIERSPEKVTFELEIVNEQEKACILAAVDHIRRCSIELHRRSDGNTEMTRRPWTPRRPPPAP